MKILYLSTAGFPAEITHTLSMLRVCKALSESGHEVLLTGRRLNATEDQAVFDYYGMPSLFHLYLLPVAKLINNRFTRLLEIPGFYLAWHFRRVLRTFDPDLVYSRLTLAEMFALPKHIPLIYEMHSPGALAGSLWQRWLFRRRMRKLNVRHIVVTTQALKNHLQQELPDIEVRIARLSAEPPTSVTDKQMADFRRNTLKGQAFEFHAGYTGYLHQVRGTGVIIQAAALCPEIAFHIVGGTPDAVQEWRRFADRQNTADNVFFLTSAN